MSHLLLLLLIQSAFADVGYGVTTNGNRTSFSVGESNFFLQERDEMELFRYGNGYFKINIGNGFGIDMKAFGGTFLFKEQSKLQIGMDFANGIIRADTNDRSFYAWAPGFSIGPKFKVGEFEVFASITGGVYGGNLSRTDMLPDLRLSRGAGLYVNSDRVSFNFNYKTFNSETLLDVDTYVKIGKYSIGMNVESLREMRAGILIKKDL